MRYLFTNRHGGYSKEPYSTFNLAFHVGDDPKNVEKNRNFLKTLIKADRIVFMDQVHGDRVVAIDEKNINDIHRCDAVLTHLKDVALCVMVADCNPILLYEPQKEIVAAVHAGRNGTFLGIVQKSVDMMKEFYGCDSSKIMAFIGPSIRKCCYEVSEEIAGVVKKCYGRKYIHNERFLDLAAMNIDQLKSSGLKEENINLTPVCTCCFKDYFSYRRDKITGRFAGVIKNGD
ncbi:peptidoglycan editing factor PgeF [Nitrosophilus alvini]|uniref:peptidoglycan editing factor PgeF n=1 Tax=Nitrosophilus alvini TaxID=2714855 RepID=UPI00190AD67C|nr:peptidoglycan editing factor PgeF [Nitrosophilus alvini]